MVARVVVSIGTILRVGLVISVLLVTQLYNACAVFSKNRFRLVFYHILFKPRTAAIVVAAVQKTNMDVNLVPPPMLAGAGLERVLPRVPSKKPGGDGTACSLHPDMEQGLSNGRHTPH